MATVDVLLLETWQNPYRERMTQEKPQVCVFSALVHEAANTVHGVL